MNTELYPEEILGEEEDDGTMYGNVEELRDLVIGHRIVRAEENEWVSNEWGYERRVKGFEIELDSGKLVRMVGGDDCCAYTELTSFLLNVHPVAHLRRHGRCPRADSTRWSTSSPESARQTDNIEVHDA